jgi:hypothetical protein
VDSGLAVEDGRGGGDVIEEEKSLNVFRIKVTGNTVVSAEGIGRTLKIGLISKWTRGKIR